MFEKRIRLPIKGRPTMGLGCRLPILLAFLFPICSHCSAREFAGGYAHGSAVELRRI